MQPLGNLVSLEEALACVAAGVRAVDRRETVGLEASVGRTLADAVRAAADGPGGDRSRMDGFAVSVADLEGGPKGAPRVRAVQGRALAGGAAPAPLASGMCYEVATGAHVPPGADAVVPAEQTGAGPTPGTVAFPAVPARGAYISRRGSDFRAGEELVAAGVRLMPVAVATAASAGVATLPVISRPRILVVPTGDEVSPVEGPLPPGHVRDSNSYGLAALVAARGASATRHDVVSDDPEAVAGALRDGSRYDAAVFTGGTSAGVKDHLAPTLRREGSVAFHGVRLRPGKPILFGNVSGVPVLGLPGNPTSCMLGAHLFLGPLVEALSGAAPAPATTARAKLAGEVAAFVESSPPDFLTLPLVHLAGGRATPVLKDSMSVTGASRANGYFAVPPGAPVPRVGDPVAVTMFG